VAIACRWRGKPWKKSARSYILAEAVIERLGKRIDPAVLAALLKDPRSVLQDAAAAQDSAQRLMALSGVPGLVIEPRYDQKNETQVLAIKRMQHGNLRVGYLDSDFLNSGDYTQIKQTAQVLQGLIGQGAFVKRGEHEHRVAEFKEALDWLLEEVKKGVAIQRYKGLGE
jgi:DNA gyrase subunit B